MRVKGSCASITVAVMIDTGSKRVLMLRHYIKSQLLLEQALRFTRGVTFEQFQLPCSTRTRKAGISGCNRALSEYNAVYTCRRDEGENGFEAVGLLNMREPMTTTDLAS